MASANKALSGRLIAPIKTNLVRPNSSAHQSDWSNDMSNQDTTKDVETFDKKKAQDLMWDGVFVAHTSEPDKGYMTTRIGNIETHDGLTINAAGFWYNRTAAIFDNGWFIHPVNRQSESKPNLSKEG